MTIKQKIQKFSNLNKFSRSYSVAEKCLRKEGVATLGKMMDHNPNIRIMTGYAYHCSHYQELAT